MPVIGSVDPSAKRIHLAAGVREYHPVDDLYRELRALRRTDESLRPFEMPLVASGNVAKGGGKSTPRLVTFRNGWKVVPEDVSHTLSVTGEQITDDGQSGPAAIDFAPLAATSKVVVQYEPPAAEIIEVETGSGVTPQDKADIARLMWDELVEDHVGAGSLGKAIADIKSKTRAATVVRGDEFVLPFAMINTDGELASGLSVSARISQDGGATASTSNSVTEIGDGLYHLVLTAAEMDAGVVALSFTAPGARPQAVSVTTHEAIPE